MKNGWVKLWRRSLDSPVFAHPGMWKLFSLCLMKASHKSMDLPVDGLLAPVRIEPGQFITGRYALWSDFHQLHLRRRKPRKKPLPSPTTLREWLLTLHDMQMLNIKSTNKYSIISIVNWNQYQESCHQAVIKPSSSRHKQEGFKDSKNGSTEFLTDRWSDIISNE